MSCACGNQVEFSKCCGPFIGGKKTAETVEELIRSRYSAFTRAEMDYVFNTHHPKTREEIDMEANQKWAEEADWLGLEIVNVEGGAAEDKKGIVEFKAKFKMDGKTTVHHEESEFRKDKGRWYFYDARDLNGETFVREAPKLGRNDPCSCGSGKKYKKCCGAA